MAEFEGVKGNGTFWADVVLLPAPDLLKTLEKKYHADALTEVQLRMKDVERITSTCDREIMRLKRRHAAGLL